MAYSFGAGVLIGTRTDIATQTPFNFGLIQDVTIEDTPTTKQLIGQFQRPVAIARGSIKTTGKARVAKISGNAFSSLYFGVTPTPGMTNANLLLAAQIPGTPYTLTGVASAPAAGQFLIAPAPFGPGVFAQDAGPLYAATGIPFIRVASAPAVGQYTVNEATGVYVFSAADTLVNILLNFTYTTALATTNNFTVANQLLGTTPTFKAKFYTTFQGVPVTVMLNQCVSSKLSFATKLEDFVIPEMDFECFADAANNVMTWSFGDSL
jgi:hypothetical protein